MRQSPLAPFLLAVSTIFFSAGLCPSGARQLLTSSSSPSWQSQPASAPIATPSQPAQAKKSTAPGPAATQSTHYPILILVQGPTQDNGQTWSVRVGLRGPERFDRTNYPPIPLEPGEVIRDGSTDAWTYKAKDSQTGAAVSVHLAREPCSDPGSTAKFTFTATVEHSQIGTAQGCARIATDLFPKINNQPTEEEDDAKDKPPPPTVTHFKVPTAVAYMSVGGKLIMKRGRVARAVPGKAAGQPDVSHDGKRLVFTTELNGETKSDAAAGTREERAISIYDWTTGKSSQLLAGSVQQPFWSPDDTRIAFRKFDGSKWQLWTVAWDAPEKAALVYPGDVASLDGWADPRTLLADDLQTLSWIGDDGTVKQTVPNADLYGKDQFRPSSANTVRVHPLNPDLLLVSAELLPTAAGANSKSGSAARGASQPGAAFFLYEVESKRRVVLSPPELTCSFAEWSRDGLQIYFTCRQPTGSAMAIYKMFWDGTSQAKVQDGYDLVIGQ